MEQFASWLTDKLVQQKIIKSEDRDLYAYGFWQGIFFFLNMATVVVIGLLSGMLWQSLLFTAAYAVLRSMAGGYHARTEARCYMFSVVLLIAVLSMLVWFPWNALWIIAIIVTATIVVFRLAPVEDENKPLDKIEQIIYRKRSRWISIFLVAIASVLLIINQAGIAHCIVMAVLMSALMLILGRWKNRRGNEPAQ